MMSSSIGRETRFTTLDYLHEQRLKKKQRAIEVRVYGWMSVSFELCQAAKAELANDPRRLEQTILVRCRSQV